MLTKGGLPCKAVKVSVIDIVLATFGGTVKNYELIILGEMGTLSSYVRENDVHELVEHFRKPILVERRQSQEHQSSPRASSSSAYL